MDAQGLKNVIKIGLESQKQLVWNSQHENDRINTTRCPLKLDFDAPSCTASRLSLFQICSISAKLGGQQSPELSLMGGCGSEMTAGEGFRNHVKNITTSINKCHNYAPKGGFRMVSRASRTGSKARKHC